jgi:tetratricopeptide (TPR) repeat protein
VTYALMHRYTEAAKSCDEALHLTTQPDDVYFLMGVIQLEQGDSRAAEETLRQAVALNSGVGSYHAARGVALFEAANLPESQRELARALALDPQGAPAYLWRARVRARQGEPSKAIADYETYMALAPDVAKTYQELEPLYRQAGQAEKAVAAHTKYVSLKAEKGEADREPSFLEQLWLTRIREGLGPVGFGG